MKKFAAMIILLSVLFSALPAFAGNDFFKKNGGAIIGVIGGVYIDKANQRDDLKRRQREARNQDRIELERSRVQNQIDIERNRTRILIEKESAQALKREEALKDLEFNHQYEMRKQQLTQPQAERQVIPQPQQVQRQVVPQSQQPIFNPDGTVDFAGYRFKSVGEFGGWLQWAQQQQRR